MARMTDLPPEVRLKIYELLLVDSIRDGLRITMTFDPFDDDKITCGRARCAQTEQPHKKGHCADPCCVDVPPYTLHHLDFTDLWSLSRANKKFYVEASETIYNNADLTYLCGALLPVTKALKRNSVAKSLCRYYKSLEVDQASKSLSRYLKQHSAATCSMLHSLIISDASTTMTSQGMKSIVDLINTRLPNLRILRYHVDASKAPSLQDFLQSSCLTLAHTTKVVQPFARLRFGIATFLEVSIPEEPASAASHWYHSLCEVRERLVIYADNILTPLGHFRRGIRARHESALQRGEYLYVTSAVRSMTDMKAQNDKRTAKIEEKLYAMKAQGSIEVVHRGMQRAARILA